MLLVNGLAMEAVLAAMRFTDATAMAGLDLNGTVIAVADYDGDGDQDLYAANDRAVASERSGFLLRNDLGLFVETTGEAGVVHPGGVSSAIFADYDDDRRLDLYIVRVGANLLYRNVGDGRFEDVTGGSGTGDRGYGNGATAGDFDGDGDVDLYVTNVGPNTLLRNDGGGRFTDVTDRAGVGGDSYSTGAAFVDYDHDGDLDLFVLNYLIWSVETERQCYNDLGEPDYCAPAAYKAPASGSSGIPSASMSSAISSGASPEIA